MPKTTGVTFVSTEAEKMQFIQFPYDHYKSDTFWVAPLVSEQKKLLDTEKNPFFTEAEMALFLAEENGEVAGRIAAIIDYRFNEYHDTKTGFFGFFESRESQAVTDLLFRVASDWLREKGMNQLTGPANPSMMDEIGILVEGFEKYPYVMMPYHKAYYDSLIRNSGMEKAIDMFAFEVNQDGVNRERMNRAVQIVKKRMPELQIREVNLKDLKNELKIIHHIFNEAWKNNWGFIPLRWEEIEAFGKELKSVVDPRFAHVAEIDGEPVAFSIALPDYNQVLSKMNGKLFPFGIIKFLYYRRKIDRIRTALMGVLPKYRGKGIDALLHHKSIENGLIYGKYASELSWILETNKEMIRVAERIGATRTKTYRMYRKEL